MRHYTVDAVPGDGIGPEVVQPAIECLDHAGALHGFSLTWRMRDWGTARYLSTGEMMPAGGPAMVADADAIFLGAVGSPQVPDHVTLWGLLIPLRQQLQQYVNLRPVKTLPGMSGTLAGDPAIDMVIVRENTEGEYSSMGGTFGVGTSTELSIQESIFTRQGVSRIARYARDLAASRSGRLISATKSNGIIHTMPFWDAIVDDVCAEPPGGSGDTDAPVVLERVLIDALCARLVMAPASVDVIVASNLFGDILSDLAAALTGSLGLAPSGNINPEREFPSMFEPVHGSAPDIAGQGKANPIAQIWAGAMMLEHLGETAAAEHLLAAVEAVVQDGAVTPDLGGSATTREFAAEVASALHRGESDG